MAGLRRPYGASVGHEAPLPTFSTHGLDSEASAQAASDLFFPRPHQHQHHQQQLGNTNAGSPSPGRRAAVVVAAAAAGNCTCCGRAAEPGCAAGAAFGGGAASDAAAVGGATSCVLPPASLSVLSPPAAAPHLGEGAGACLALSNRAQGVGLGRGVSTRLGRGWRTSERRWCWHLELVWGSAPTNPRQLQGAHVQRGQI